MPADPLVSFAQNGEDVVLWRALGHVANGIYVDVGAADPVQLSVTKVFYDRGWRGIDIDPVSDYARRLRESRPGNEVVQAAVTDADQDQVVVHVLTGTGLSTLRDDTASAHDAAGFDREDVLVPAVRLDDVLGRSALVKQHVHLLKVDAEGAEAAVLRSIDLARWRPWVVVVEATRPLTTEPSHAEWDPILIEAGYACTLFDGLSRFYVSDDHCELIPALSYPACVLDDFVTYPDLLKNQQLEALSTAVTVERDEAARQRVEMLKWRNEAVTHWADAVSATQGREDLVHQLDIDAQAAAVQAERLRATLAEVRADRKQLREKVRRLSQRVSRLRAQLEEQPSAGETRESSGKVRAAVKRLVRR